MAKERLFNLPQTRGSFQLKGKVSGVEKNTFYTEKKTQNGNDFRAVNFGVTYDENSTVYVGINGMPKDKVHFSKRVAKGEKSETKAVDWNYRNSFAEDGYNLIGITCGIEQKRNDKGGIDNVSKVMVEYDAAQYLNSYLEDQMDVFMSGNIEFNSFTNKKGETICGVNYRPTRIYSCKTPIDFDDEKYEPQHDFKQTIVFKEINQEKEDDKPTGRFIVSAWIVNYGSIENTDFIVEDKAGATFIKKKMHEYEAVTVWGKINCRTIVEEVEESSGWGTPDPTKRVSRPTVREMVITGGDWDNIDKETYTEKEMNKAFDAIRKSKNAEENFADSKDDKETDSWGSADSFDEDSPW